MNPSSETNENGGRKEKNGKIKKLRYEGRKQAMIFVLGTKCDYVK
jgi:hypothetical protein